MSPSEKTPVPGELPSAVVLPGRRRLSLIWAIPLLATLIGLGLAVKTFMERGPTVTLQFVSAEGVEANKTRIKYKDVDVGTVTAVTLAEDRKTVTMTVQMANQASGLLTEETRFWVVRPRISGGSVSGLGTLLSGAFISLDPGSGKSTAERKHFIGLENPPQITSSDPGREFILKAHDLGSLEIGSPVYFRRIQVGRITSYKMGKEGRDVTLGVFVNSPYEKFVTTGTRFWHASGIDVSVDSNGAKFDMQSVVSLMLGGVAFSTPLDDVGVDPAPEMTEFTLYDDKATARKLPDGQPFRYQLIFKESVRGLEVGAPVDLLGVSVGNVIQVDIGFDEKTAEISMVVLIEIYPSRVQRRIQAGVAYDKALAATEKRVDGMVTRGMRAQLRTGSLVTGQLYIALDNFPNAKPATVDRSGPIALLPTQPSTLGSLQNDLAGVLTALKRTLDNTDKLVQRLDKEVMPEVSTTLGEVRKTLDAADRLMASDSPTQLELRDTLREVSKAATALRQFADLLERQPEALLTGKKEDAK